MCDRCPLIGCTCGHRDRRTMMSILGGPQIPYPDPLHMGLLGGGALGHSALGLSHNSLLSVPLWRPSVTHAPTMWCSTAGCPCGLSRATYNDLMDFYSSVPSSQSVWRPWYSKSTSGDSIYKRNSPIDSRESPTKELPTKILKHERMKERQELSQTLSYDRDHLLKLKSRCTGTQTQISHLDHDLYMNGERRHHLALALVDYHGHRGPLLPPPPPPPPPPHPSQQDPRGSPPKYTPMDTHDAPLNLSLSSSSISSSSSSSAFSSQVSRPSVITCAPTGNDRPHHYGNASSSPPSSLSPSSHHAISPNRREVITEVCDPAIEEHFRRSLGRSYDYMSPKSSPKVTTQLPPPPLPPQKAASPTTVSMTTNGNHSNSPNVSITGSVDEHFAKSLGSNTWSAIKAKESSQDMFTGSVDDHFAKALGDTWLRIKAEREPSPTQSSGSRSPPQNMSPRQQRHDSSLLST